MVEIVTPPHTEVPDAVLQALKDFQNVITCAAKEKMVLYAYGTYPGEFQPQFRKKRRYQIQQEIFGKQRFSIAGRCVGLHIHYSLPWGVFNNENRSLKPLTNSQSKENMISMYNLAIAMDPALIAFTQSSPFYQGSREGNDSRVLMYRGGEVLKKPDGLYANYPEFGALPNYESTNSDLLHLIADRAKKWKTILQSIGRRITSFKKPGMELTTNWSPVRINQHGTIELRGMDMNHPDIVVAVAVLIKFLFKAVQEKHVAVIASDTAVARPFKYDGRVIYIPPSTYVR
jgi:gamma-glutamylcysteine synthetase